MATALHVRRVAAAALSVGVADAIFLALVEEELRVGACVAARRLAAPARIMMTSET